MESATPIATQPAASIPLRLSHHRAWTGDDGPPIGGAHLRLRTPDGYLWLGGSSALYRFDGVRFTVVDSTTSPMLHNAGRGQFLPRPVTDDGTLWITRRPDGAIFTYRDGRSSLVVVPGGETAGHFVARDGARRFWRLGSRAVLEEIRDGSARLSTLPAVVPDPGITNVVRDRGRGLRIGTRTQGLWHVDGTREERTLAPGREGTSFICHCCGREADL